ncbi:hypothetical protein KS18_12625 [Photorhabdus luminescens]|nr:hypothetical protein KS18_12625 [Photorhabdus luminescens]
MQVGPFSKPCRVSFSTEGNKCDFWHYFQCMGSQREDRAGKIDLYFDSHGWHFFNHFKVK